MNFYDQINQHVRELNSNERKVFEYVIRNTDTVKEMSIRMLAETCFVSTTTILRFTRKLGFSGYRAFIDALKIASHETKKTDIPLVMWHKSFTEEYLKDILESIRVTSSSTIEKLCARIDRARCVICYGSGLDGYMARYLFQVLLRLDVRAICPGTEAEIRFATSHASDEDIAFIFSLSGEDQESIEFVEQLVSDKHPTIATITQSGKNTIATMGDVDLYVFTNKLLVQDNDLSSRVPVLALIDFISYGLIKRRS